ncbi:MAG TPA: hypothetical protein VIL49_14350 [Capillimicrobium sp.]|jgi:ABC-type transport system involved in multi-copper enzyme maturation permease subunit
MTTAAPPAASAAAPATIAAPSLLRLTRVELRKMVDTRAGLWLLISVAALTVAFVVLIAAFGIDSDKTFVSLLSAAIVAPSFLMPVVGILLVTSEFTQRTALVTFALVPRRARVFVGKAIAALLVALVAFLLCIPLAGAVAALAGPDDGDAMTVGLLGQSGLSVLVSMAMGLAFGLAARASAPAIVAYFLIPIAWTLLGEIGPLQDAALWLDPSDSLSKMTTENLSALEWARAATSIGLFLAVPLAIGAWRMRREELQ